MTYQQLLDALRAAAEAGDRKAAWMLGIMRSVRQ
jgi:NaMN:DMB phosphoribosyltransferase